MKKNTFKLIAILILIALFIFSCADDEQGYVEIETPVDVNLENVPYAKLSDYFFFVGELKNHTPNVGVLPYEPASGLFTDYAHKKRFIWMPAGVMANYTSDSEVLNFPVGTVLIKTFYYTTIQPDNSTQYIETRIMIRKSDGWKFYEYIWNEEQTDADLVIGEDFVNGSSKTITFKKPNNEIITANYRIPSDSECFACHKINETAVPIGVKPQNINFNYTYSNGSMNQLQKLVNQGYLQNYPATIASTVNYNDTSQPLALRARSYLDINCAHCHQDQARCEYRPVRFPFRQTIDDINVGICLTADEAISPTLQKIISPGNFSKSIMHFRISTNDESERMPLLGRTIMHDEGVTLIEEWISTMTQECD